MKPDTLLYGVPLGTQYNYIPDVCYLYVVPNGTIEKWDVHILPICCP